MFKEINGKNKFLFCLLSIGLFVGFYFGEDSSGGGSIVDFASTWPMVENLFYYDGDLEIKFPLHYYIASLIYYIVADKEVLRLIYVTASIFIPLLFYRCLKEKYKNIDANNLKNICTISNSFISNQSSVTDKKLDDLIQISETKKISLIKIKSKRLYNEMKTFVWHSGRPQAMKKYNDESSLIELKEFKNPFIEGVLQEV